MIVITSRGKGPSRLQSMLIRKSARLRNVSRVILPRLLTMVRRCRSGWGACQMRRYVILRIGAILESTAMSLLKELWI